jgi:NAD-dependent deacetylase sirtuin 4
MTSKVIDGRSGILSFTSPLRYCCLLYLPVPTCGLSNEKIVKFMRTFIAGAAFLVSASAMVSLHGRTTLRPIARAVSSGLHEAPERPPNPHTLLSQHELQEKVEMLLDWLDNKKHILTITGAGLSTESGIPDYRGHNGSYHRGHKPMIHDQFMSSHQQRQRYWGRGMVGWRSFDTMQPNVGHYALATLEKLGRIGVTFEDKLEYYSKEREMDWMFSSGDQKLSLITQNVDSLHRRAGSVHITELHGRTNAVKCMKCGARRDRVDFHDELEDLNHEWLQQALAEQDETTARPDGDAYVKSDDYSAVVIPPCTQCGGFMKPDVVFFGDSVPKHRVERCRGAVDVAGGLLCVGSSLAVHSAFRFVRHAHKNGIPIAILNVGETRAETEGLNVVKIEAPVGPTLESTVSQLLLPNNDDKQSQEVASSY